MKSNERAHLLKRIQVLENALRPFAREARNWHDSVSNGYRPGMTEPRQHQAYAKADFSMRDLRRAAKLVVV